MILSVQQLVAQAKKSVECVTAKQAFSHKDALFFDVREPEEVAASRVKNSIPIPRGVLEMNIAKHCSDPHREIYLHCASGGRATLAVEQLQRIGYKNVKAISCDHQEICKVQNT